LNFNFRNKFYFLTTVSRKQKEEMDKSELEKEMNGICAHSRAIAEDVIAKGIPDPNGFRAVVNEVLAPMGHYDEGARKAPLPAMSERMQSVEVQLRREELDEERLAEMESIQLKMKMENPEGRIGQDGISHAERQDIKKQLGAEFFGKIGDINLKRCAVCKSDKKKTTKCAFCQEVYYCSPDCKDKDWIERHKTECGRDRSAESGIILNHWANWLSERPGGQTTNRFELLCDLARCGHAGEVITSDEDDDDDDDTEEKKKPKKYQAGDWFLVIPAHLTDEYAVQATSEADKQKRMLMIKPEFWSPERVYMKFTHNAKLQEDFAKRDRDTEFYAILFRFGQRFPMKFVLPSDAKSMKYPILNAIHDDKAVLLRNPPLFEAACKSLGILGWADKKKIFKMVSSVSARLSESESVEAWFTRAALFRAMNIKQKNLKPTCKRG